MGDMIVAEPAIERADARINAVTRTLRRHAGEW